MDSLIAWFRSHGGKLDTQKMGLTDFPISGRGAIALQDIPEDHLLFSLPRNLTLSTLSSSLPQRLGDTWKQFKLHQGWVGLILCMMYEEALGSGSKWHIYLDSLPSEFHTPMFWGEEDLKELEGTSIQGKIGKDEAESDYYNKLRPAIESRPDVFNHRHLNVFYTLDKYHIMGSRALSRSFQLEKADEGDSENKGDDFREEEAGGDESMDVDTSIDNGQAGLTANNANGEQDTEADGQDDEDEDDEDEAVVAMVPMADMLNARYGSVNAKLYYEGSDLQMKATRDIKAGEQIWNTYGDPPNADLLRRYGHVDLVPTPQGVLGNPADVVEVSADFVVNAVFTRRNADLHESKLANEMKERIDWWLEEGGDDVFVLDMENIVPDPFASFCKLLLLDVKEWEKAREKGKPPKPRLDVLTLPIAIHVLESRLQKYSTTLQVDEEALKGSFAHDSSRLNKRHALIVRIGEKRILYSGLKSLKSKLTQEQATSSKDQKRKREEAVSAPSQGAAADRGGKSKRSKR